ncbi:hypothetical protein [Aquimarina sp. I32.4]|uniref:hypothetical protein n=1 Tax=Aquimarina sp. I32.4 TaxID=2053903 RepID=UPI000CDF287F|nr:hypothetical protein [Aquimarina sp. I32.4]
MKLTPKKIFLIDGLGALLTAFLLAIVLTQFEDVFGMPQKTLLVLSSIACVYAGYSLFNYKFLRKNWKFFMIIIAIANVIYCCLILYFIFFYKNKLTNLGIIYFLLEIFIIISLTCIEINTIVSSRKNN